MIMAPVVMIVSIHHIALTAPTIHTLIVTVAAMVTAAAAVAMVAVVVAMVAAAAVMAAADTAVAAATVAAIAWANLAAVSKTSSGIRWRFHDSKKTFTLSTLL